MIETLQHQWEFGQLLALAQQETFAENVLELGVWQGGTLDLWRKIARHIVAVDLDIDPVCDSHGQSFVDHPQVTLIEGNSHDDAIIEAVRELGPYDVVFVDADHGFIPASLDWTNYSPMVKPGGIFAFHDIRRTEHATLDTLWNEIKRSGMPTTEFNKHDADWGGIGVVHF